MRTMPRLLLLLFCMSVVTMMFIARCGISMDGQSYTGGLPLSSRSSPGEKALREVMRRKDIEHIREKSTLQKKIKSLETQLAKVQGQVVNLTLTLRTAEHNGSRLYPEATQHPRVYVGEGQHLQHSSSKDTVISNQPEERSANTSQVHLEDIRLAYPNDGLNPVPRYQNDKHPVFDQDDRKSVNYRKDGKNTDLFVNRQENIPDNAGSEYRHNSQFGITLRKHPEGQNIVYKTQINHKDGSRSNDIELKESIFHTVSNRGIMLDRRAIESAEVLVNKPLESAEVLVNKQLESAEELENKHKFYPSLLEIENSLKCMNKTTGNESEPIFIEKYFLERLRMAEILKGQPYKTEYELIPFNRFIFNRIFLVDPGLGKRVVEKPIGSKKKDLNEILYTAVETLNTDRSDSNQYTYNDFIEGIYRSDPATGSQYELFFSNKDATNPRHSRSYIKLTLFRPFAPPIAVQQTAINTDSEWINIILPLSKRVDTFRIFMDQFVRVCIKRDKRIYLTVVYFGADGLKDVKSIMSLVAKTHKFKHMKLVTLNETFTRGRGLQLGALNWKGGGDVLLFFCDVDIIFTSDFLERCRLNSDKGLRVYYPIVFSLYNPNIVYSLQDAPLPSLQDQLIVSKDTGFWRDFGYGMACLYRSDFLKIKGFDEQITGWGGEDVFLYQKFVRSEYFVVRATDPAIFHLWHEKVCEPTLSTEQYRSCIRSKALNEASHAQLGLLAFKDEIDVHRGINDKKTSILNRDKNG